MNSQHGELWCSSAVRRVYPFARFRLSLYLFENRLAYEAGERANHTPIEAELPQCRRTEALTFRQDNESRALWPLM